MKATRTLSVVGLVLGSVLCSFPSTNAQTLPALPQSYVDTSYSFQAGLKSPQPSDANSSAQSPRPSATILSKAPLFTGGTPDPTLLPFATTTQVPLTAAYNALNVPGIAAGGYYLDPLTGVKVYKLTSSVFPTTGFNWGHDYAEGGNEVSLPLNASGTRAIKVLTDSGTHWLIDFTPGIGVSNARNLSASSFPPLMDLAVSFSNNPATPYYMYVSDGTTIHRIDLRTMTEAPGGGWPVTGETNAMWLHQNENDTFFTWMRGASGSTIVGYEPATGIKKTYTNANLNEPRIDRDASNRFVCISMTIPQNQALFWDWQNNVITWSSPTLSYGGEPPVAHQASMRGYWIGVDWNISTPWPFFKISASPNSIVNPLPGGGSQGGGHCNGNWIQHPANPDDQWYECYYYGALIPPSNFGAVAPGGILLATANGQRRILAHLYNTSTVYTFFSFAKLSSDGGYVLFTSDMNGSPRSDLFLAEMPTTGTPPPDITPPSVPTGLTATAISSAQINLAWIASTDPDSAVAGYKIFRGGTQIATSASASYSNTGLSPSTAYTYAVSAYDAAGNVSAQSASASATTQALPDTTSPSIPAGLTATALSSSQINLAWIASTDPDSAVAGYKIFRGGTQIATSASTSYSNTGLSPSTAYTYTVSGYDAAGNVSAQSASASATTQATTPPPTGGNIVLLHLDENPGSTVFIDASGSGNNGSCISAGCPTAGVAGKVGEALSFNGVSNFVTVTHKSSLNAFPLTVATWFKTTSTVGVMGLVSKYVSNSYNGYNVFLNNGNVCAWYLKDTSNYVYDGSGCTFNLAGYNDNAWHQVVYVVDSSGGKLYLDGVQKGTTRAWTGVAGSPTTTQDIHLGNYPGAFGGQEYFQGLLDEVRIYNAALTANDVSALFTADNNAPPPPQSTSPHRAIRH
jgi:chitodextrinase